jgi:hypothetical protein
MNIKPPFKPLISTAERQRVFGKFDYKTNADGTIKILGNWANQNIVRVHIPQLEGVEGANPDGMIYFHRLGVNQLKALFEEWDAEGLSHLILSFAGAFVPRMIRGSKTTLSNHAFGTAFDINAAWNGLGKVPAAAGKKGSVIPLVEIAHKHGFYWGGNFTRLDGMHFELAVIQPESSLKAAGEPDAIQQHGADLASVSPSQPSVMASASEPTQPLPEPLNAPTAATERPQQTVESGGAATQVVVQPNALDNKAPVSSPFDEPIKVLKGKAGNLLNYFSGAGVLGGVWAFTKDNPWLVVFFVTLIFLTVLTIVLVNHHKKVIEARTAANPDLYKVAFVKEVK